AVGAADLGDAEGALGIANRVEQRLDALEPGAHARDLATAERQDACDRFPVGHDPADRFRLAKNPSMRRRVSRSWRRPTTSPPCPCSRRNAERWKPAGRGGRMGC